MRTRWLLGLCSLVLVVAIALPAVGGVVSASATEGPGSILYEVMGAPGSGPADEVGMGVWGLAHLADRVLVGDHAYGVVRAIDPVSLVTEVFWDPRQDPGAGPWEYDPRPRRMSLRASPDGTLLVAVREQGRLYRVTPVGRGTLLLGSPHEGRITDAVADLQGNVYVVLQDQHAVIRLRPDGTREAVVGDPGRPGHGGVGGPAAAALLAAPSTVAIDPEGRLLIGEAPWAHDHVGVGGRLLRIEHEGTLTRLAGANPDGRGGQGPCRGRPPLDHPEIQGPTRIEHDPAGRLTFLDGMCLWRLEPDGTVYALGGMTCADDADTAPELEPCTWVPNDADTPGPARQRAVGGVESGYAFTRDGTVFLVRNDRVYRISLDGTMERIAPLVDFEDARQEWGVVRTAAADGVPASSAQTANTRGLAVAGDGTVFLSDSDELVRRIDPDTSAVTAVAGIVPGTEPVTDGDPRAWVTTPRGLDVASNGDVLIGSGHVYTHRLSGAGVLSMLTAGDFRTGYCWDTGDGGPARDAWTATPLDVTVDRGNGDIYLYDDAASGWIRRIDGQGTIHTAFRPRDLTCEGSPTTGYSATAEETFRHAVGVAAHAGVVHVADTRCIWRLEPGQEPTCAAALTERQRPLPAWIGGSSRHEYPDVGFAFDTSDVAAAPDGTVVFTDPYGHAVRRLHPDGTVTAVAGTGEIGRSLAGTPAAVSRLAYPTRVAVDRTGVVYVADSGNHRIVRFAPPDVGLPVLRLAGPDRGRTAVESSRAQFGEGAARAVVLARSDEFADALSGAPLAAELAGPLLLTSSGRLDGWPESEIRRVLPTGRTVHLLGGTAALAPSVELRLRQLGYRTTRYAGRDRYETAVTIAEQGLGSPSTVLLATGGSFADAVSASASAASIGAAVLLTADAELPQATARYLAQHAGTTYAVGGPAAAAAPRAIAVVGSDRYATSALLARRFFPDPSHAGLATGLNFPDALAGGAQMGGVGGPILLTPPTQLGAAAADYLRQRANLQQVRLYGGYRVLDPAVRRAAASTVD